MITTVCKISYGSQTVPPIVPAVQGDTGRAISFEIADFTPPAGATATYFILKPSGEAIYNSATITDNSILCELTAQSLAEAGENRMQVRVLQGEDIVTSFEVILMVRTFLGDDAMESGTEMNIFDQAVEQATEDFQTNAEQIVAEVIQSIPADYTELTEEVDELNERINNLDPGLSDDAKTALLNCFAHVAWVDEHGQDYYDELYNALYGEDWDYVWSANSGVVPNGMTSLYYDFTTEPGALYVKSITLSFPDYNGDMIMSITAKTYSRSSEDSAITLNSPQFIVKQSENNGAYKLIKVINNSGLGGNDKNRIAVGINGTNTLISDYYSDQYNKFEIKSQNGTYALKINDNAVPITQNQNTTQYGTNTGISGYDSSWSGYTEIFLKEIKIKLL